MLRYLATGIDFCEMHNAWRVGFSTLGKVVMRICEAIIAEFHDKVLKMEPTSLLRHTGWQALQDQPNTTLWKLVPQLQKILQHCLPGPSECQLRIHLGGHSCEWFLL